jgi:hypothetical protein
LKLSGVKVKEGEEYHGVPLTLRQVTITTETGDTLFDEEGRAVTSCVIVQGPPRVAATLSGDDKAVLALHWPEPRKSEEWRRAAGVTTNGTFAKVKKRLMASGLVQLVRSQDGKDAYALTGQASSVLGS